MNPFLVHSTFGTTEMSYFPVPKALQISNSGRMCPWMPGMPENFHIMFIHGKIPFNPIHCVWPKCQHKTGLWKWHENSAEKDIACDTVPGATRRAGFWHQRISRNQNIPEPTNAMFLFVSWKVLFLEHSLFGFAQRGVFLAEIRSQASAQMVFSWAGWAWACYAFWPGSPVERASGIWQPSAKKCDGDILLQPNQHNTGGYVFVFFLSTFVWCSISNMQIPHGSGGWLRSWMIAPLITTLDWPSLINSWELGQIAADWNIFQPSYTI